MDRHHPPRYDEQGREIDNVSLGLRVLLFFSIIYYLCEFIPPFSSIHFPAIPSIPLPSIPDWLRIDVNDINTTDNIVTVMLFALGFVVFSILRRKARNCGTPGCRALNNADRTLDFQIQDENMLWDKHPEVEFVDDLPACRPYDLEDGEYESHMARLKEMAPNNGRAVLIIRLSCGCPFWKLSIRGPRTLNRRRK